jgi:TatD DNase family protein
MYFDTHSHVQLAAYKEDRDAVMKRSLDGGVWMVNVGTSFQTSKDAVDLAGNYPEGVYASIGLHPGHTWHDENDPDEMPNMRQESFNPADYEPLINDKVVAIGEIGLDYYRVPEDSAPAKTLQKKAFIDQLHFAQSHDLPIIIHCRDAYEDTVEILKAEYKGAGIIHSFTDSWETAKKFLDLGFYLALNGILIFDKTGRLAEVCKNLPSDRILSETDAPYLTPPPNRGKRNEPLNVRQVVEKMAQIRGVGTSEMSELTFQNALTVYGKKIGHLASD